MSASRIKLSKSRAVFLILTAAVMAAIFILSSQTAAGSSNTSSGITKLYIKVFHSGYDSCSAARQKEIWSNASFIVRKCAHFSIYAVLGFFASFTAGKRRFFSNGSLGVVIFGFLYAFSDEIHQKFSEGRSCEFRDMMIDTCGVITGMVCSFILVRLITCLSDRLRKNN